MNFFLRYLNHLKSKATGDWLDSDIPFHGFAFRSGSHAQTKGIWMWPEPFLMRDRNGEEVAILLLDCQGLTIIKRMYRLTCEISFLNFKKLKLYT
jgi:hypothetical protein